MTGSTAGGMTDEKRVERELMRTNERLAIAADSAGLGIWEHDLVAGTLRWDDRMYLHYGRCREEAMPVEQMRLAGVHPDERACNAFELEQAVAGARPFEMSFRIVRPDGLVRHIKSVAHVSRDDLGKALLITGVNTDVTEQVEGELALLASEALLNRVGRLANVGGWRVEIPSRTAYWGEQTRRIHEVPDDYVPTIETGIDFFAPEARGVIAEAVSRGMTTGEPWDVEVPMVTFKGRHIWVRAMGEVELADGKPVRMVGALQDVTVTHLSDERLREAMAKAEAANFAKSLFLANMSHEIRTPMNAVIGLVYLLERTSLDARQTDTLEKIKAASQSLLGLINDVLDLSKIEAAEMRIEQAPFSLGKLLAQLTAMLAPEATAKGIAFAVDVRADLPRKLQGDATRVYQVLTNLLTNAMKFTERGGVRLTIDTLGTAGGVQRLRFVVHDTGIGIEPETLKGLFVPFVQADASIVRRFGGTGLGLSIVKQLVTLMGGQLGATSTPHVGSEFWCELAFPICDPAALADLVKVSGAPASPRLTGARILVVDDSAINQEVAKRILELEGATVAIASNGQEAIDCLLATPSATDLILMDVQMPVLDGLNATRRIRSGLGLTSLPIIALTAGTLLSEQAQAEAAGMSGFISKPFEPDALVQRIRSFVGANDASAGAIIAAPAAQLPVSWPEVAGVDAHDAYARLLGDVGLYRWTLKRLVHDFADLGVNATDGPVELAQLAMRLHDLAGSASMIGANAIARAAMAADAVCRSGHIEMANALTTNVANQMKRLADAAAPLLTDADERPVASAELPFPDLDRREFADLLRLLRDLNLEATKRFTSLTPQLRGALGHEVYGAAREQIESLQFAAAADFLEARIAS